MHNPLNDAIPVSPISAQITDRDSFNISADSAKHHKATCSFRSSLLEKFEVASSRLSQSAKSAREFEKLCLERVQNERVRATVPRSSIDGYKAEGSLPNDSPIANSMDAFRLNMVKRARLSQQFVDDVETEVLSPLGSLLRDQETQFQRLEKEGQGLICRLKSQYKDHDDSLIHFDRNQRRAYETLTRTAILEAPQTRLELARLSVSSLTSERKYHEAVLCVNQTRNDYVKLMGAVLDELEGIERTRIATLKDCMDKMFIYELSLCRGTQYELECGFKEIEESHTAIGYEIDRFIESVSKSSRNKGISLDQGTVKIISVRDIVQPPTLVDFPEKTELQSVEKNIIARIWTSDQNPTEFRLDELEAISEAFTTHEGRLSFCKALTGQLPEIPSQLSASNLGKVLNTLLTASELDMDPECGRRVASFALKFYFSESSSGRKRYMQSEIYHHSLWNRIQFWEEALVLTVSDFLINQYLERIEGAVDPSILNAGIALDRFGTYLMVFGISVQSALDICRRVMERDDFDFLEDNSRAGIRARIDNSINAAHEKQERNAALLQNSLNSPKPVSPSL